MYRVMDFEFCLYCPGSRMSMQATKTAIRSFALFYHELTPKHQRKVKLLIRCKDEDIDATREIVNREDVAKAVELRNNTKETLKEALTRSCVVLFPFNSSYSNVIPDALSMGLPVIALDTDDIREYIDLTSGLIVKEETPEQVITDFAHMLGILYFDQEVLKILERGAVDRYEKCFSWGLRQFRKPLF